MQNHDEQPVVADATRREVLKKLGAAGYIAPVTVMLLSSEKAAAY